MIQLCLQRYKLNDKTVAEIYENYTICLIFSKNYVVLLIFGGLLKIRITAYSPKYSALTVSYNKSIVIL